MTGNGEERLVDAGNAHKLPFELFPCPRRIYLGVQRVPFCLHSDSKSHRTTHSDIDKSSTTSTAALSSLTSHVGCISGL